MARVRESIKRLSGDENDDGSPASVCFVCVKPTNRKSEVAVDLIVLKSREQVSRKCVTPGAVLAGLANPAACFGMAPGAELHWKLWWKASPEAHACAPCAFSPFYCWPGEKEGI